MKTALLIILAFSLNACVPDISGDVDNSIDNSIVYGEGTVLNCTDANCSVAVDQTDPSEGDAVVGVYSADYNRVECTSAGFFYCTIEDVCLDQPISTGTCD